MILGIFLSFSLKAHNYYPAYHIGPDFSNLKVPALSENSLHGNVLSFNAIICCAKEARALMVLDIECECNLSCKIVKNCRIIGLNRGKRTNSVRGLYDKKGPHSTVYLRGDEKKCV